MPKPFGHKLHKGTRNTDEKLEHASYEGLSDKWVSAEALKRGDGVLLSDGKYGIVISEKTENCEKLPHIISGGRGLPYLLCR